MSHVAPLTVEREALRVEDAALNRFLGYPAGYAIEGQARALLQQTRAWFHAHARPWRATVETQLSVAREAEVLLENGAVLRGPSLAERIGRSHARRAVVACVTLGEAVDERVDRAWAEDRPDRAFFLDAYASAAVAKLVRRVARAVRERARRRGLTALPHSSPGYDGWPLDDQRKLFDLLVGMLDGRLRLLDSGMLIPRKSLLGLFPLTAELDALPREALQASCRACSMPACSQRLPSPIR